MRWSRCRSDAEVDTAPHDMETGWLGCLPASVPPALLTSRQMLSASWRACARFMCGRNTVKRSPDRRQAKLSAPISARRMEPPQRPMTLSPVSYTHLRAHETPEHLVC